MTQATQTIPNGYKQTEIGVIPVDWEVKKLGEIADFYDNLRIPVTESKREVGIIPYYGANGIQGYINGYTHDGEFVLIAEDGANDLNNYPVLYINRKIWVNNHAHVIQGKNSFIKTKYLSYALRTVNFVQVLVGGTRAKLNGSVAKVIKLTIPKSQEEQTAIATVLSDTDTLIEKLEKLIDKKKAVKQGAMQQLLTGKKRLPGFSGEWEVKKLEEIGEIVTGNTPSTKIKEYWEGNIPWITPTDINERKNIYNSEREITPLAFQVSRKLPINTLLVTCIASIGKNTILKKHGACNQQINAIIPNYDHDVEFLYYLVENNKSYLLKKAGITATLIISKKEFSEIEFRVPKNKNEQTAIATILSDMDAEIEKLENKLDKYHQIKTGMMQQLLTGKIRLLKN